MIRVSIQNAAQAAAGIPSPALLRRWAKLAAGTRRRDAELTIRIVNSEEIQFLNQQYRHKNKSTNVLSFPFEAPPGIKLPLLGDVIICASVVAEEADTQHKPLHAHFAHMVIHGVLHLLGYDHMTDSEAALMEALEIKLLADLGYPNPYGEQQA